MEQPKHHSSQDTEDGSPTSMRGMYCPWFLIAQVTLVQNNPQFFLLHSVPCLINPKLNSFRLGISRTTTGRNPNHQRVGKGHVVYEIDIVLNLLHSGHTHGQGRVGGVSVSSRSRYPISTMATSTIPKSTLRIRSMNRLSLGGV